MVGVGLSAISRQLPYDEAKQQLSALIETASFSEDGGLYVVADAETLLVGDAENNRVLGLRVHDYGAGLERPALSPKGSVVVAPSGKELLVYESRGLVQRLRVATRRNAPYAFVSDDKLVTVRLGDAEQGTIASRGQLLQRTLPAASTATAPTPSRTQKGVEADAELSDDEIVVVDLHSGKSEQAYKLVPPPDQGLLRKVASLPPSQRCNDTDECQRFELNPVPIGRRVDALKVAAGMVIASWHGGATTIHRLRDGKLMGAFRSRGERWKPGLVAIWPKPPRAAVVTSLPGVGRGNEPPFSVTALFDLTQGRVIELIDECRWATGLAFSVDGNKLMVGDLRRACLHDGKTGRYLQTTDEVRPARGYEDDMQDVSVRPAPLGRWLLTTADGTFGVFDGTDGSAVYRGRSDARAGWVGSDDKSLYVADFTAGEAQLISFGPSGVSRRLLRSAEIDQKEYPPELANSPEGRRGMFLERLLKASCVVEGFRLPIELCTPTHATSP